MPFNSIAKQLNSKTQIQFYQTMLAELQTNDKLFRFDDDSQSEAEQASSQYECIPPLNKAQNPQKLQKQAQIQSDQNYQSCKQQNSLSKSQLIDRPKYQSVRRNKSFKVKNSNEESTKNKVNFSKSVSKFGNIFEDAEQIYLNSSNKFAIHEQRQKQQTNGHQYSSNKFKSVQSTVSKNCRPKSILKLSSNPKVQQKPQNLIGAQFSFRSDSNYRFQAGKRNKILDKTAYSQGPMHQILSKKLSSRTQSRLGNAKSDNKDTKIRLRVDEISDLDSFIHKRIPSMYILIAKILKNNSGFNLLWPEYQMRDLKSNIHILSAKKKAANTTSNYYISRNQKQIDVQNADYTGKVRSNFVGSCFNIFNQGLNPENSDQKKNNTRKLLATIIYESQIANANPKTMRVYIIKQNYTYYDLEGTSIREQETNLEDLYEMGQNRKKIHLFTNRKPTYIKQQNKFVLNFDGRIKRPSTKNFILQDCQTKKQVLMFGKNDDNEYLLYLSSPLTPHIGLGVALAQLDSKIICD